MPELPHELWIEIFRLACGTMGAFDTSPLPPLHDSPRAWNQIAARPGAARAFTLVSKQWYNNSRCLLYEYVILQHSASFFGFLKALKSGVEDMRSADCVPIGHATKRIDLGLKWGDEAWKIWQDEATLRDMSSVFSLCSNLRSLLIETPLESRPFLPLAATSMTHNCPELCYVDWTDSAFGHFLPEQTVIPWLGLFPRLRVLALSTEMQWDVTGHILSLPNLHTLKLFDVVDTDIVGCVLSWYFPALKTLTIECIARIDAETLGEFFYRHGPQIITLDLSHSKVPDVANILSTCTAVDELIISCSLLSDHVHILSNIHPLLKRFSLRFWDDPSRYSPSNNQPSHCMGRFFLCMQIVEAVVDGGQLPYLTAIRLADFESSQFKTEGTGTSSHMSLFTGWRGGWSKAKIRFEDRWGQLIELPPYTDANSWDWDKGEPPEDMVLSLSSRD